MPRSRYDLLRLWLWLLDQRQGVTAREIAEFLGCEARYVTDRILPSLEFHGYFLSQCDARKTHGRPASVYEPMRPDENGRGK